MSRWHNTKLNLFHYPVKWLADCKVVPSQPVAELGLDPQRPIVYALKTNSSADLLSLQSICRELQLPGPLDPLQLDGIDMPRYVALQNPDPLLGRASQGLPFLEPFLQLLKQHKLDPQLDIQLVPVTIFWGRSPGKETTSLPSKPYIDDAPNTLAKAWRILRYGRDGLLRFSQPVSLRQVVDQHGSGQDVVVKVARVARFHFHRQYVAVTGPKLPDRQHLFRQLLRSQAVEKAIADEIRSKKISEKAARKRAVGYMDEIATDFSYRLIRFGDHFLSWLWNKLYQGINVKNAERVRRLNQQGHEIVYVPCHRSHMDYLLLSYVIYHQGMVPPHIAAGINLNFWPAGPLFRRGGAFFIRRSFRGNKLYSTVFREYLSLLFQKGYAVEYYTEGGRSRTGRLLPPKTGMIAMTLQAMLRGQKRPITLIPVYIGYEHVMEVSTYHKELKGKSKQKESFWQVLGIVRKLRNYGEGFVNFGEPIPLEPFLNQHAPDWRDWIDPIDPSKPRWLNPVVAELANRVMTGINQAGAINALNLIALVLLGSERKALTREELLRQMQICLELRRRVPFSQPSSVPDDEAEALLEHALKLNKLQVSEDSLGQIISLDTHQAVMMTYYRNNIIHMFALPGLITAQILAYPGVPREQLLAHIKRIYPLLQAELYLHFDEPQLTQQLDALLSGLTEMGLLEQRDTHYFPISHELAQLKLLSANIQDTLQRYAIVLTLLKSEPGIERGRLESSSQVVAERLGALNGINAPEFFDKKLFSVFIGKLKELEYLSDEHDTLLARIGPLAEDIDAMLSTEIRQTIGHVMRD